jgi:hypothetical protein
MFPQNQAGFECAHNIQNMEWQDAGKSPSGFLVSGFISHFTSVRYSFSFHAINSFGCPFFVYN